MKRDMLDDGVVIVHTDRAHTHSKMAKSKSMQKRVKKRKREKERGKDGKIYYERNE